MSNSDFSQYLIDIINVKSLSGELTSIITQHFISGASMNPARSLSSALVSGKLTDLWLYWSATFVGTTIVAFALRKKMTEKMEQEDKSLD